MATEELSRTTFLSYRKGVSPRVVTVASKSGQLKILNDDKRSRITAAGITTADVDAFANEFISSVEAGTHVEDGWPNVNLGTSQLCKIAFQKALAAQETESGVFFVMACPGHCRTDMSSMNGSKSAEEGSRTPAMLALMEVPEGEAPPTGKVYLLVLVSICCDFHNIVSFSLL